MFLDQLFSLSLNLPTLIAVNMKTLRQQTNSMQKTTREPCIITFIK